VVQDHSEFGRICISFDTAWSPPLPIITKMSNTYNGIDFKLKVDEPGCDIHGEVSWYNGQCRDK